MNSNDKFTILLHQHQEQTGGLTKDEATIKKHTHQAATLHKDKYFLARMYPISYLCIMIRNETYIRNIFWTEEFSDFYHRLSDKARVKFDYVLAVIRMERVISTKFVKHLENTDLYEMRVSVGGNEYRTIMFTMNHANVMLATEITLLNAFMKKSTKDYSKQIKIAETILKRISHEED